MEPSPEATAQPPSLPGEGTRPPTKGSSFHKVNKVLAKGVKQFFVTQKDVAPESYGLHHQAASRGVRQRGSFLRSYLTPSDDDLPASALEGAGSPATDSSRPPGRRLADRPGADRRRSKDWGRSSRPPVRPHFVPKGWKRSPEAHGKRPAPPGPLSDRAGAEEGAWAGLQDLQSHRPRGVPAGAGGKTQQDALPPTTLGPEAAAENLTGIEADPHHGLDDSKAKPRARFDEGRRFTISGTLSKMKGFRKEKAEQVEEVSLAASPSPINLSLDESLNAVASEQQEAAAILERLKAEQDLLQQKVLKITEELRVKQASRSANVSEYLHLISHTDQAQAFRLKKAFEKKNQYLSSIIAELQRRLESYIRRQQQLDREVDHLQEKDPTLHRHQGARSGYPQEEAQPEFPLLSEASTTHPNGLLQSELEAQGLSHLSRKAQGSFSSPYHNINQPQTPGMPHDAYSVITSFTEDLHDLMGLNFGVKTSRISSLERQHIGYLSILEELTEIKETQLNLDLSFKNIAEQYNQHYTAFEESLQEEKYRSNQLQAQMNDLIDLHQNEVQNLKSELASLEEKIAYQSYESSRDIWEVLESFQSKMTRLEQQQQQGEILDHVNTRELLGKSMNLLLIMFAVVLMLMSTVSAIILPFIKTRARTVSTCVAVVLLILMWHNWELITAFSPRRLVFRWR